MGKSQLNGREFVEWIDGETKDGQFSPKVSRPSERRRPRQDRKQPARTGQEKADAAGGRRTERSETTPIEVDVKKKTPQMVLKYIESLANEKDYFRKLEHALKENVSVLVPLMMSMEQFTKCLSNLRDSNIEADKSVGTDVDPIAEIRAFLSGEAV